MAVEGIFQHGVVTILARRRPEEPDRATTIFFCNRPLPSGVHIHGRIEARFDPRCPGELVTRAKPVPMGMGKPLHFDHLRGGSSQVFVIELRSGTETDSPLLAYGLSEVFFPSQSPDLQTVDVFFPLTFFPAHWRRSGLLLAPPPEALSQVSPADDPSFEAAEEDSGLVTPSF